jgi:hypothetical protein
MKNKLLIAAAVTALTMATARADVLDLGTSSPLTITDIAGITSLAFSPTPDTDSKEADNNVTVAGNPTFSGLFPNQNAATVQSGVASMFGIPTSSLTFIALGSGGNAGAGTFTPGSPFNFVAIHQDSGEIVLDFATAQSSITFGPSTPMLSDMNFFSATSISAVPEPSTWAMLLLGFIGLAFAFRRKRQMIGLA